MLGLIPLYIYRQQHPTNLILLFAWTPIFSGACCCHWQQGRAGEARGSGGGRVHAAVVQAL